MGQLAGPDVMITVPNTAAEEVVRQRLVLDDARLACCKQLRQLFSASAPCLMLHGPCAAAWRTNCIRLVRLWWLRVDGLSPWRSRVKIPELKVARCLQTSDLSHIYADHRTAWRISLKSCRINCKIDVFPAILLCSFVARKSCTAYRPTVRVLWMASNDSWIWFPCR